jgi:hypothetical protein
MQSRELDREQVTAWNNSRQALKLAGAGLLLILLAFLLGRPVILLTLALSMMGIGILIGLAYLGAVSCLELLIGLVVLRSGYTALRVLQGRRNAAGAWLWMTLGAGLTTLVNALLTLYLWIWFWGRVQQAF